MVLYGSMNVQGNVVCNILGCLSVLMHSVWVKDLLSREGADMRHVYLTQD